MANINTCFGQDIGLTLRDLQSCIAKVIKNGEVTEAAKIVWADKASKYNNYGDIYGVPNGSLLFGLEWIENGEMASGTLKIEPPVIMNKLN